MPYDPVILIGMHRSGSSLLGRLIGGFGLFSGALKDQNDEALFFLESNKRLMARYGARWDAPTPVAERLREPATLQAAVDYAAARVGGVAAALFLGPTGYLRCWDIRKLERPWGWKDPRNTFTLPVWLRIFPHAKVLFLERHGVDVALSLKLRSVRTRPKIYLPWRERSASSIRCSTLEGGLSLWAEYQARAKLMLARLPPDRFLELRYEELLENPIPELFRLAAFCGLEVSNAAVESAAVSICGARAYAYRRDERLVSFAANYAATLEQWGYSV